MIENKIEQCNNELNPITDVVITRGDSPIDEIPQRMVVDKHLLNKEQDYKEERQSIDYKQLISYVKDRPGHDQRYAIDCEKLKSELGWTPEENFESGIRKTVRWYLNNRQWVERVRSGEYQSWIKEQYG